VPRLLTYANASNGLRTAINESGNGRITKPELPQISEQLLDTAVLKQGVAHTLGLSTGKRCVKTTSQYTILLGVRTQLFYKNLLTHCLFHQLGVLPVAPPTGFVEAPVRQCRYISTSYYWRDFGHLYWSELPLDHSFLPDFVPMSGRYSTL
jgi:hypothetical protein